VKQILRQLRQGELRYHDFYEKISVEVEGAEDPVHIQGSLSREGSQIMLRFRGRLLVHVPCDRCLKEASYLYQVEIEELLEPEEDEQFDLAEIVNECFVVQRPSQVLCDAECKGLCPYCGADRNETSCDCGRATTDPRFDKLKSLL
jgi:uncharacterized protein